MMKVSRSLLMVVLFGVVVGALARADERASTPEQLEYFEKQVRPLFAKHCYQCHSVNANRVEAKLLLDSREAQLRGGDSGAAIVPGDAEKSLLIEAVRYESFEMGVDDTRSTFRFSGRDMRLTDVHGHVIHDIIG